jgi:hypothetical protein
VAGVGNVAGGKYFGRAGPEVVVHDDAVVDPQPRSLDQADAWGHANPDDDVIGLNRRVITGNHTLDRVLAFEPLDGGLGQELDAVVAVKIAVDPPDLRTENSLEGESGHFEHRHLAALLHGRGRDLGPDPTGADDDESLAASIRSPIRSESESVRR